MTKELIGLDVFLYTYKLSETKKFNDDREKLSKTGVITEVFVNNGLAFEHKKYIAL